MEKKYQQLLCLIIFVLACNIPLSASWVWNPETGWINTKYDPQDTAQNLYQKAITLQQEKKYAEAVKVFNAIIETAPNTPEAKKSLYEAANSYYIIEKYYDAYTFYEEYLRQVPNNDKVVEILTKQYDIGIILVRGTKQSQDILDFEIQSSASLGIEILQHLIDKAAYINFADDAQLMIANYYFKNEEYQQAQIHYQKLLQNYPKSEWAGFAQYQISVCLSKQTRGPNYDVQPLQQSEKEIEKYFQTFKQDQYLQNSQNHLKKIREDMAQKELDIARYYLFQKQLPATRIYLICLIQNYGDTQVAKEAQKMLREFFNE